ncbi:hypothetical protein T459_21130 [Capsicum annuum]|uniref:AIPP2-like SPOC-like domain-containing protein n=1 Tax=Capsicum annuum TaxID=4072 RepID=A0A2G2YVU6_CAPAN|nr:hypothetical protein T459_21130 [Capsicum annuum]
MCQEAENFPFDYSADHMGSFDILGDLDFAPGMFNNFIHSHPPSRVRRNVYEFSRLLPDTLKFELVPCGDNWASLFNDIDWPKRYKTVFLCKSEDLYCSGSVHAYQRFGDEKQLNIIYKHSHHRIFVSKTPPEQ